MVKRWIVKNHGKKASFLRKEPVEDASKANVMRMMKNGDIVSGEFLHVRRASREAGFVSLRHVEPQCGSSWRVRNADGSGPTPLRKQPHEASDPANTVGFAAEGEVVVGEFVFVVPQNERKGGYLKLRHLRTAPAAEPLPAPAASVASPTAQCWTVMDSGHDGAWLRRTPHADSTRVNVVCLIPNGDRVVGEFVHVRRNSGEAGFLRFRDLRAEGKVWRARGSRDGASLALWRQPTEGLDAMDIVARVAEGERLEGEFVFVAHGGGKRTGYVKRRYLTALASSKAPAAPLVT